MKTPLTCFMVLMLLTNPSLLVGQIPFNTTPTWISSDVSNYSTGVAWVDLNNNGWLDLVVANGNDMARQRVAVYYNNGDGSLPLTPNWQSTDIDYHGHLAVGDVNGDGYADVAVSVYIGPAGFGQKGRVKLYMNTNGTLSSLPVWTSADSFYTFSLAFGDANGNGLLDLAVACGEAYTNRPERNRIYYNTGEMLDPLPGWMSSSAGYSYDVAWADFDNNGWLDLVFVNERGPNQMYRNYGDSIGTVPVWTSTDPSQYANSLFVADVNNDGYLDLAVSDNNQLGGTGKFKIYLNNGGTLGTTPFWSSQWSGYGSGITLVDVTGNGYRDLVTGGWWQPLRIYGNMGGAFVATPQWTSATSSVVEAIVFGDVDNDALDTLTVEFVGDGTQKLFYLPQAPLQRLDAVVVGEDTLTRRNYCYDLELGWVSLGVAPEAGDSLRFHIVASRDLDMAVSNWDPTKGNYLFKNLTTPVRVREVDRQHPEGFALLWNYPNPFNPSTTIGMRISEFGPVTLKVYDILGREVATLVDGGLHPGTYEVSWGAAGNASGVYYAVLRTRSAVQTMRMMLIGR